MPQLPFRTGVNLVLVPVVARDRPGRAMGNFAKGRFPLFDRSKPQVITKFSIETQSDEVNESSS